MKYTFQILIFLVLPYCMQAQSDTILTNSGLKFVELKQGRGIGVINGSKVKVRFTGKFVNGKIFETTEEGSAPLKFTVGAREVIPGWDEALLRMKKGGKALIIVPPSLAYGLKGFKNPENEKEYMIPPNSTLIYEIWLLDVK